MNISTHNIGFKGFFLAPDDIRVDKSTSKIYYNEFRVLAPNNSDQERTVMEAYIKDAENQNFSAPSISVTGLIYLR